MSIKPEHPYKSRAGRDVYDWITLGLVVFATVVAVFAAGFTWWQASIARETGTKQIRAYVIAKPGDQVYAVNMFPEVNVGFRNAGQTPAQDLQIFGNIGFGISQPSDQQFEGGEKANVEGVLDPSTDIANAIRFRYVRQLTQDELAKLQTGGQKFFVWGIVKYADVFGIARRTYFCFSYFGRAKSQNTDRAQHMGICDHPKSD